MFKFSFSKFISLFVGIVITIPIFIIFSSFLKIDTGIWSHLKIYVLPELILNTLKLICGVGIGTLLLGVPLAYINSFYDYPGRRFFSFLAILPMSIPAYIMAFVYVALFDITGIWSLAIKDFLGLSFFLPSIRNFYGISLVLSLCFYPYVYLLSKNAFEGQGARALEVSRVMGLSKLTIFFKVILPLSRPWIFSGVLLALMETIADFGAVSIFNYTTFTTAIYRSWFGLFSLESAQQLAAILISFVFLLMIFERLQEKKKSFTTIGRGSTRPARTELNWTKSALVILASTLISLMAFIIPFMMIIKWALKVMARDLDIRYISFMWNSIEIASLTVIVLLIFSFFMAYAVRKYPGVIGETIKNLSSLGYAVPGSVLAVGVFIFLSTVENKLTPGEKFLTSGLSALIIGLSIRFYSISLAPIANAFLRITDSHFHIMALSSNSSFKNFFKAIAPMIRPGLLTAALMVFVEVMKEMPITLMTRPFGKETLSIRIFEMTSEGEWERAALPSLFLIIISLIPTILLFFQSEKNHGK